MQTKKYQNFQISQTKEIPEIQAKLTELIHEKSGAKVMHIDAKDDENLFCVSFQTFPMSSNGVAHILEHIVLCGSKKYPIRDPFFSMARRSMNTFMNAFTGADFTCYPAASLAPADFYHLLDVYLDSVFHPLLTKMSFLQEGHRLEFSKNGKLQIKGIVYNEMKGALIVPETRLTEALMKALFPDVTYGVNSGGDPKEIPLLTYEELLAFHRKFYHPSRALFFFYGNLPLEKHLNFLEENILNEVESLPPLPPIPKQKRFEHPLAIKTFYPIAKEENKGDKTFVAFGWLTTSVLEQEELLALNVLDLVLMGTDASPLKLSLLNSGLCKQADSSLEDEMSEVPYFLVCKGCKKEDEHKIEALIFETLKNIELPLPQVEGAIHQLELSRKEISVPYGLSLYFRSALLKQHGGNPEDGLKIHTLFASLREKVKDEKYLKGLIKKHFLENRHFVRMVMEPDPKLQKKEHDDEAELIKKVQEKLTPTQIEEIKKQAKELEALQERKEDIDLLPKLDLHSIPKESKEFELIEEMCGSMKLFYHPCFTNEIIYLDLGFDLPELKEEELPYLRLFSLFLPQVGCGGRNYKENLDYIFEHTGGISCDIDFGCDAKDPYHSRPYLALRGKALNRKAKEFCLLIKDMIATADFRDKKRLEELLIQHHQEIESHIQTSPLRYAMHLAASSLSVPLKAREALYGLKYFQSLNEIKEAFENNPSFLIEKLEELKHKCLGLEHAALVLGGDQKILTHLKEENFYGLTSIPLKPSNLWKGDYKLEKTESQGRMVSSSVAFTTLTMKAPSYIDPFSAYLSIASKLMENKILHKRIREQGGAYGSGCAHAPMSGYFYFYAYRDPHLESSAKAFEEAVQMIVDGDFDDWDIEEAKIGVLQDLDTPVAPGARAYIAFERLRGGRTRKVRQEYRTRLLQATKDDIMQAVKKVLVPGLEGATLVSFASAEFFEKDPLKLPTYQV